VFRESDALQPLAAAANHRDEPRAAAHGTRARVREAEPPSELKAERAISDLAVVEPTSGVLFRNNTATPPPAVGGHFDRSRLRFQAPDGTAGRRRF
jgi:hypothetical protein